MENLIGLLMLYTWLQTGTFIVRNVFLNIRPSANSGVILYKVFVIWIGCLSFVAFLLGIFMPLDLVDNVMAKGALALGFVVFAVWGAFAVMRLVLPKRDVRSQISGPVITSQPVGASVAVGESLTLSVGTSSLGATFQWYEGISGDTNTPILGATGSMFVTSPLFVTKNYWVRITAGAVTDSETAIVDLQFQS